MQQVTIYSTPTCHFCHLAKDFFKENNVPFVDYDVMADPQKLQEMRQTSGQMGVPVIVIGNNVVVGFDRERIADILQIK